MSSSDQMGPPRKSKGRQKVNMVKMEKQSNLQVTFSKRRAGLFKKASELCTLCGAEAAIIVFSPAEKAYCFGHPNIKALLDRLSDGMAPTQTDPRSQLIIEAHRNSTIRQLNWELTQVESLLRAEKKRAQEIEAIAKRGHMPTSFDDFNYAQLCVLKESITGFKKKFDDKVQKHMVRFSNNPLPFHHHLHHHHPPVEKTDNLSSTDASCVPTFDNDPRLSLGLSGFGFYSNGATGFSHSGFFAPSSSVGEASSNDLMTNYNNCNYSTGADNNYTMFNFIGGNNISSSSKLPATNHSKAIGATGSGFNLGHDHHRLF